MCNIIFVNVKHVNNPVLIKLYKSFVRLLSECATVIYNPHHINHIAFIENQRKFTKPLQGLCNNNMTD